MPANGWRTIQIGGQAGIPDDGTVGAVSFTATAIDITQEGWLEGRPSAAAASSKLGIYGGYNNTITTFGAVVAVSPDGTIEVKAQTQVRLIIDVQGYYTASQDGTAPGGFVPLNGDRIVDSRSGLGAPAVALASGQSIDVQATGVANGIPSDASAGIVNLIPVNTTASRGWLTPYPTGSTRPENKFHYPASINTSMQAQVELSDTGKFTLFNSGTTTHVVIDLQGYFTATSETTASFTPAAGRIYDSRTTTAGSFASNETRSIQIAAENDIPDLGSGINAIVLTLTSLGTLSGTGRAVVWADGEERPDTTALSLGASTLRTNTITVPIGDTGAISLQHVGDSADYVLDVQGWYISPLPAPPDCAEPSAPGVGTPCTEILDENGAPVSLQESAEGDAFWVEEPETSPQEAPGTYAVPWRGTLEDLTTQQRDALTESGIDVSSLSPADPLTPTRTVQAECEVPLGTDIDTGLAECPPPTNTPDATPPDGELTPLPTSTWSEPLEACIDARTQVRYRSRTDACYNASSTILIWDTSTGKIVGTFRVESVTRTWVFAKSTTINNDTYVRIIRRTGVAVGRTISMSGSTYDCWVSACSSHSGSFGGTVGSSWRHASGTSTFALATGAKASVREAWKFKVTSPTIALVASHHGVALGPRCDNNAVAGMGKGCVYPAATPVVSFATTGSIAQMGNHVRRAISEAKFPSKLTRTTPANARANRDRSCPRNASLPRDKGYQCDEYPFASSTQGGSTSMRVLSGCRWPIQAGTGGSRCMILEGHNSAGAIVLSAFYSNKRVLPGDKYGVRAG